METTEQNTPPVKPKLLQRVFKLLTKPNTENPTVDQLQIGTDTPEAPVQPQTSTLRTIKEAIDSLQLKKVSSDNIVVGVNTKELKCAYGTQSQMYEVPMESILLLGVNFKCWFIKPYPQELRLKVK